MAYECAMEMKPLYSLPEFRSALPPKGRLIALDVGEKTIGIAVSDGSRMVASPDLTLMRKKWSEDAAAIEAMIENQDVVGMVIGYPVNMDGTLGPRAQSMRGFARMFQERLQLPILLWDERMSTMAVNRMMIDEADLSRARRAEVVDKLAASYILQGVLDAFGHQ